MTMAPRQIAAQIKALRTMSQAANNLALAIKSDLSSQYPGSTYAAAGYIEACNILRGLKAAEAGFADAIPWVDRLCAIADAEDDAAADQFDLEDFT